MPQVKHFTRYIMLSLTITCDVKRGCYAIQNLDYDLDWPQQNPPRVVFGFEDSRHHNIWIKNKFSPLLLQHGQIQAIKMTKTNSSELFSNCQPIPLLPFNSSSITVVTTPPKGVDHPLNFI